MAKTVKGQTFKTQSGLQFNVLADRFFPAGEHDQANGSYLDALREGYLVSTLYHGVPVPLVTLPDGVVKLNKVGVAGLQIIGSGRISQVLGVAKTRRPVKLTKM